MVSDCEQSESGAKQPPPPHTHSKHSTLEKVRARSDTLTLEFTQPPSARRLSRSPWLFEITVSLCVVDKAQGGI